MPSIFLNSSAPPLLFESLYIFLKKVYFSRSSATISYFYFFVFDLLRTLSGKIEIDVNLMVYKYPWVCIQWNITEEKKTLDFKR